MFGKSALQSQANQPKSASWRRIISSNPAPEPRGGHASVVWDDCIIIFGGQFGTSRYYHDVQMFNLTEQTWIQPTWSSHATMSAKSDHSMCVDEKGDIIIFGGKIFGTLMNGINRLNIKNSKAQVPTLEWQGILSSGDNCPGLCDHTANIYKNKMYVFGGCLENLESNDLWELSLDTMAWKNCVITGHIPYPRSKHCSAVYDGKLYIFGGVSGQVGLFKQLSELNDFYRLDLESPQFQWELIQGAGFPPSPRSGATMQAYRGVLFVFGGQEENQQQRDDVAQLFAFSIKTSTWIQVQSLKGWPRSRSSHTSAIWNNELYILDGYGSDIQESLDIWKVSLEDIPDLVYDAEIEQLGASKNSDLSIENETFNLIQLFTQKCFTDIILEVEAKEFACHKAILAQRCKFFDNLFNSGMSDSNLERLPIVGVKADSFEAMMKFIYGDPNLAVDENLAFELLSLSDKYLLPTLKTQCEKVLTKLLSLDNFTKVAKAAEIVESDAIKEAVFRFARQNINILKEKGDLYDLSQSLLIELFANIVSK